ncbi:hypothetical protein OIU85_011988 [Salix viminalis]|uniref:RING-type domain-containing protein n=1 Tax=Salix viminalis TaxID=40686 RepID=A0A9Q0NTV7_SALVM|nr:hypothetical protein OIU85_011988 [Salix viminalis]
MKRMMKGSSCSSSEDLYDAKLCVICYDDQRNCFFVPCGHCATCYDCAQRIMEEDNKMCPICRRLIHKMTFRGSSWSSLKQQNNALVVSYKSGCLF